VQERETPFQLDRPVLAEEVRAALLQFVGKTSAFNKVTKTNEAVFLAVVDEMAGVSAGLTHSLETIARPKNRKEVAARAKARSAESCCLRASRSSPVPVGRKAATAGPASVW
jgi:hypothetical protein